MRIELIAAYITLALFIIAIYRKLLNHIKAKLKNGLYRL